MKDGNAGNDVEFAGGNMPVIAGHLEVYALGDAPNGDNVEDL